MRLLAKLTALVLLAGAGCGVLEEDRTLDRPGAHEGTPPPDAGSAEAAIADDLVDRLNDERVGRGLAPLSRDPHLDALAREWSGEMAAEQRFEHRDLEALHDRGDVDAYRHIGENLFRALDGRASAGEAHLEWMRSDGHRQNLLEQNYNRVGVGVVCTDDGDLWVTQKFGLTTDVDGEHLGLGAPSGEPAPSEQPIARPEADGPSCHDDRAAD